MCVCDICIRRKEKRIVLKKKILNHCANHVMKNIISFFSSFPTVISKEGEKNVPRNLGEGNSGALGAGHEQALQHHLYKRTEKKDG